MIGNIGPMEIAIVLIIALVVFGPKRLPELGKGLGRGMREFKESVTGEKDDDEDVKALAAQSPSTPAKLAATPLEPADPEVVHDRPN